MKKLFKDKFGLILLIFSIIMLAGSISYFSYSIMLLQRIETLLRLGLLVFFIVISIVFIILIIKCIFKRKRVKLLIIVFFAIAISGGLVFVSYNINKIYSAISNITAKSQTFSSSLVVLKDSDISSIDDIGDRKIGILKD